MKSLVASVAAVLWLAGCGSSSSPPGGGGRGSPTSPPPPPAPSPPSPSSVAVDVRDFTFNPPTIRVAAGGRVTWTNGGATQHTTTSDGGLWDSGLLQVGSPGGSYGGGSSQPGTFSREFAQAGTFAYHCALHPTVMRGTVIVSP